MSNGAGARDRGQGNREERRYRPLAYLPAASRRNITRRLVAEWDALETKAREAKRRKGRRPMTVRQADRVFARDPIPPSLACLLIEHRMWKEIRRGIARLRVEGHAVRVRDNLGRERYALDERGAARIVGLVQAGRRLLVLAGLGFGRAPVSSWEALAMLTADHVANDQEIAAAIGGDAGAIQDRRLRLRRAGWELGESRSSKATPDEMSANEAAARLAAECGLEIATLCVARPFNDVQYADDRDKPNLTKRLVFLL
jgi:hypothetical protein